MKVLQILILIFGLIVCVNAQEAVLSGTVYDQIKARVVATEISIKESNGKNYRLKTDDRGAYKINLPFGNYTAEFIKTGFKVLRVTNLKIDSSVKNLDVVLEVGRCEDCNGAIYGERSDDSATLSGTVYDQSGAVVPNVEVKLKSNKGEIYTVRTNEVGEYNIEVFIGFYSIEVKSNQFKVFRVKNYFVSFPTKGKMFFDITLIVKGEVSDRNGFF